MTGKALHIADTLPTHCLDFMTSAIRLVASEGQCVNADDPVNVQQASADTVLTPRFYTTDFDQMEEMFNLDRNPNLPMEEFEAMLSEFSTDYNQTHFVRNETFKKAAEGVQVCLKVPHPRKNLLPFLCGSGFLPHRLSSVCRST